MANNRALPSTPSKVVRRNIPFGALVTHTIKPKALKFPRTTVGI